MTDATVDLPDHRTQELEGRGEFQSRCPQPRLAPYVSRIAGYREHGLGGLRDIETASLVVPLVISFGERFHIGLGRTPEADDAVPSFAAGLFAGPVHVISFGRAHCLQINFTPLGAYRFFGMPMSELAATMAPVDALADRDLQALARRLEDAVDWHGRFDLAEALVARRVLDAPVPPRQTAWAYKRLAASGGRLPIGRLADELGWSRKHLAARFREAIGLPPKAVASIMRFNSAQALAAADSRANWADIAAACGYADQAHLGREFRRLSGQTPGAWHAGIAR